MSYFATGYDAQRLGALSVVLTETLGIGATTVPLAGQYIHGTAVAPSTVQSLDPVTGNLVFVFDQTYESFATALKFALDLAGNANYDATFNPATRRYTITATGGGVTAFTFTAPNEAFSRLFGYPVLTSALVWTSSVDVWHWSYPDNLGYSRWDMRDAAPDGAEALMGADGSVRGLSPLGTARMLDAVVPSEPRAAVRSDENQAGYTPRSWTWQRAYYRARSVEPCVISPDGIQRYVVFFRPDYTFAPRLKAADYLEVQDVPLSLYVVGELV